METQQVARRYANGLFRFTQEKGTSEAVHTDFGDLAGILKSDDLLLKFLDAPQIVDKDKLAVVEKIFHGNVALQLYDLMRLLVAKRRTDFLLAIAQEYEALYNDSKGIVATRLVTAVPLTDEELNNIRGKLNKLTGKSVAIIAEVDADIIGGVIAFVGDKIIDRSIRHDIDVLREQLMELKVLE